MGFPSSGRFGAEAIISVLGVPVTSTPVTVYVSGTTTLATLYTDHTSVTTTTNPISTDGLGNLTFYTAPGAYDLAFTVGGVATTQTVVVDPWPQDLANPIGFSDYDVLAGTVPDHPNWIFKSKSVTVTTTSGGIAAVTFPTAFPNAITGLIVGSGDNGSALLYPILSKSSITVSGFHAECVVTNVSGGSVGLEVSVGVQIAYFATGC